MILNAYDAANKMYTNVLIHKIVTYVVVFAIANAHKLATGDLWVKRLRYLAVHEMAAALGPVSLLLYLCFMP